MQNNYKTRTQRIKHLLDAWWQEQNDRLNYIASETKSQYVPCHKNETQDIIGEIKRHLQEIDKGNLEFEMYSNVDYGAESLKSGVLK